MDILYSGGVNNPMDSIEQISYLLFLRLLTEKDDVLATLDKKYERIFSGKWARFAWGNFVTLTGDALFDAVRDAIEHLHELPGLTETGKLLFSRATLKIYDRPTFRAVVQGIHALDLAPHEGHDFKGDMYEYLLSKLSASGTNGQFRTPRHIIDLIVALGGSEAGAAHLRSSVRHGRLSDIRAHAHPSGSTRNPPISNAGSWTARFSSRRNGGSSKSRHSPATTTTPTW